MTHDPKTLRDLCLAFLCKPRPVTFSSKLTLPFQLIPDVLERFLANADEGGLPYTIVTQLVEHLSEKGILSARVLELLLRQSRGYLGSLRLSLTQLTFDEFLRLPPLAYLVNFDCTNVDHVTDALWEKLTPSRTSLRSFAAIGLDNPSFHFERIAEFSHLSSLNLSNTCVSVDDVIVICRTLVGSLKMLDVSECSRLDFLALLPGIRETRNLVHLSLHDLPVAKDLTLADKESVLSTFKDAFNCLSSLKFLDVGWIKDAGTVTGWDIACAILECRGSGLTHLDVSGLTTLRETLRFVKDLGIERSLQYLGALHVNLRYPVGYTDDDDDDDDDDDSLDLSDDLEAEVADLKIAATGFANVDGFVLCQPHYVAPTPRNDAILKLIAGRMYMLSEDFGRGTLLAEKLNVLSSFVLRKCRAARRSKGDRSYSYPVLGHFAISTSCLCSVNAAWNTENIFAISNELIVRALSVSPSVTFSKMVQENFLVLLESEGVYEVALEQLKLLLVDLFCHFKANGNINSDIEHFPFEMQWLVSHLMDNDALHDVAISRGFAHALIDVLESSLASSQSRSLCEEIVRILSDSFLLFNADVSLLIAERFDRLSNRLCSLYDTLGEGNVRQAEALLNTFYLLSIQKSNRSLLTKRSVLSLIWKSLNFFDSSDRIQFFAAELFASFTFESSTPSFEEKSLYEDGLSTEMFWQRIAHNCERFDPIMYNLSCGAHLRDSPLVKRRKWIREEYSLEMILSCLENHCRIPSQVLVFALWTLISFLIVDHYQLMSSDVVQSKIAGLLRSLENDVRQKNKFVEKLIEKIQSYVSGWNV